MPLIGLSGQMFFLAIISRTDFKKAVLAMVQAAMIG
jgi:hypothetical protein